jgi:hypothetical protein
MSAATPVTPDPASCTFPKPAGANLDVALVVDNDGICAGGKCYVILDKDPLDGWQDLGGAVQLPRAVCSRLASGRVKQVVTSTACPTKTSRDPVCGPWSSVGGGTPGPDAGSSGGVVVGTAPDTTIIAGKGSCPLRVADGLIFFCTSPIEAATTKTLVWMPIGGGAITPVGDLGNAGSFLGPWLAHDQALWMGSVPSNVVVKSTPVPIGTPATIGTLGALSVSTGVELTTAIDSSRIYFAANGLDAYPRAGGDASAIVKLASSLLFAPGQVPTVMTADADPTSGFVYVGTHDSGGGGGGAHIQRVSKASPGGAATAVAALTSVDVGALVVDGGDLYYVASNAIVFNGKSSIQKVPVAGGTPVPVYPDFTSDIDFLTIEGDTLYWLAADQGKNIAIYRAPKAGGATPEVVVSEKTQIQGFVLTPGEIYYANDDNGNGTTTIKKKSR